jgi:hypothetical protein
MVPPFTLFDFVAPCSSHAFKPNNVKSGTGVADAAKRFEGVELPRRERDGVRNVRRGTGVVDAAKRP